MAKKVICVVMCLVMFMSFNTIAFAANVDDDNVDEIQPYFQYIEHTECWIRYVGDGKVNCFSYAYGIEGIATKTGIDVYLQKKVLLWWTNTDYEWHTLAPGHYAEIKAYNYVLPSKGTYRIKSVVTVYSGSAKEVTESYSPTYTYGG